MQEFARLGKELARAAVSADLEYIRWTRGYGVHDSGCESLISTCAARAASAFYGIAGNVTVFLEESFADLNKNMNTNVDLNGRADCAIYKGEYPYVLIECKRWLRKSLITQDVNRCAKIMQAKGSTIKGAMILGIRGIQENDKKERSQGASELVNHFSASFTGLKFQMYDATQIFDETIKFEDERGNMQKWVGTFAGCLAITA